MMNETGKLEKWIAGMVSSDCYNCEEDFCGGDDGPRCTMDYKQAHQILQACKESGLVFVKFPEPGEDLTGTCLCRIKEIDIE